MYWLVSNNSYGEMIMIDNILHHNTVLILTNFSCIKNYLKSKTRILVTHQLQYMQEVDKIIVMDKVK